MNPDSPFYFTPAPEQAAKGEVCFNGIGGNFRHLDEYCNCLVRLLVKQIVETLEIATAEMVVPFTLPAAEFVPCQYPAGPGRRRNQGKQQDFNHRAELGWRYPA